jgi:hypothetical protein
MFVIVTCYTNAWHMRPCEAQLARSTVSSKALKASLLTPLKGEKCEVVAQGINETTASATAAAAAAR